MAVQDPGVRARIQRDLQALHIGPQMINPVPGAAQNPDLLPVEPQAQPERDLCIRRIFHRIELPDRDIHLLPVIIHQFMGDTVKISHDVVRPDLMPVQEFQPFIHSDDKFCLFAFQDRQHELFFQHAAAYDHRSLIHSFSISP